MMTTNVWLNQEWFDYKLKWDPGEYGGIEDINLPAEQIWLPDIVLYNSAEGYFAVSIMTKAKVRYNGHVIWNPPAIFRSSCQIDIQYFPFDSQNCHLKFGSWTFGTKIDLRHVNDTEQTIEYGTDLSEYYQNVEWDIMRASAKRNVITYTCCPNDHYPDVTFNFTLRRKPLFYTVNLILPCIGITILSFLVFYLPSDSGEKVTLTISILVSLIFFLCVLIETIPSTSTAMPLLGKYLVFTMILITLSVCATVGVLNIHFRTPSTHSMSPWAKRWCIEILPKYLFMNVPQYQSQPADSSPILPEQLIYPHNAAYQSLAGDWSALVQAAQQKPRQQQAQQSPSQQQSANNQTAGNRANSGATMQLLEVNKLSHQSSTSSSFLPYLTSEAARRLQMQRSRSSERASSNNCDSAANSSSNNNNNNLGNTSSNVGNHVGALKQQSAGTCDTAAPAEARPSRRQKSSTAATAASGVSVGKKGAPFWRIFGGQNAPDKATTAKGGGLEATNGGSGGWREPQPQKPSAGSRETCFSPPSSSSSSESSESEHDYRHHNHFQARASICSTNMWRIGPTRRCSLTAAAAANQPNYSTFYRPLAHLSGNLGPPLVANSNNSGARLGQIAPNTIAGRLHAAQLSHQQQQQHSSGEQAGDSAGSSESPLMGGFRSAVSALASAAATNLPIGVRAMNSRAPSCGSQQGPRQLRAEACLMPGANRHLQQVFPAPPATSCVGQQQQHLQREMAARSQILQPVSLARQPYLCSPQPTPPPPLPPDIYVEQQQQQRLAAAQAGSHLSQVYTGATGVAGRQASSARLGQPQLVSRHHSAASSNQSAAGGGASGYRSIAASFETGASNTGSSSTATTVMLLGERQPLQFRALNPSQLQQLSHQQPQVAQCMPRSRSTDHRLCQYAPALATAASPRELAEVGPAASHQVRPTSSGQRHTIGRALGQVYVQQLQRQPSICTGLEPMMMSGPQSAMRHSRLSMHRAHAPADLRSAAAPAPPDECLMMMRRSKSHSNLQNYPLHQRNNNTHQYQQQYQQPQVGCRQASQFTARHQCNQQPVLVAQRNADCDGCSAWCAVGAPRALSAAGTLAGKKATPQAGCVCHSAQEHEPPVQLAAPDAIARAKPNSSRNSANTNRRRRSRSPLTPFGFMKLISEVDKAIQNAMFIAQHIDNLDEFESVKENWKYFAMVIDRIFLIVFLFACIVGSTAIFMMVPWSHYTVEQPIDLQLVRSMSLNFTAGESHPRSCRDDF